MDYEVGDMVRINSRRWYENSKDLRGCVNGGAEHPPFLADMAKYCSRELTITDISRDGNGFRLAFRGNDTGFWWGRYMFDKICPMESPPRWFTAVDRVEDANKITRKAIEELDLAALSMRLPDFRQLEKAFKSELPLWEGIPPGRGFFSAFPKSPFFADTNMLKKKDDRIGLVSRKLLTIKKLDV